MVLASASPRRWDLLIASGFEVEVVPADIEELAGGLPPRDLVMANADLKAMDVASRLRSGLVLGADTVVVLEGEVLGKPRDLPHAVKMLSLLSGRIHEVLTGVSLVCGRSMTRCRFVESTRVHFRLLDAATIETYFQEVDPLDKAGAYAAQEDRGRLIERIEGSMENVIGLPVERVITAIESYFTDLSAR